MAGLGGFLFGDWAVVLKTLANAPRDFKEAKHVALLQEAEFFRARMLEGLREQAPGGKAFKPLSQSTLIMRKFLGIRGTKALLQRGDLRNSIHVTDMFGVNEAVFVGILRTAKGPKGESLVDVAEINENGSKPIVIRITPQMQKFLMMIWRQSPYGNRMGPPKASTGIIVVQIPARPFMAPVFEKYGGTEEASRRFAERFAKQMKGKGPWQAAKDVL